MKTKTNNKRINYIFKGLMEKEERIKFLKKARREYYFLMFISILIWDITNYSEPSLIIYLLSIVNLLLIIRIVMFTVMFAIGGCGSPVHGLYFLYSEEIKLKKDVLKLNHKIKELNISNNNQGRY